jgi:hopene-associated glycosyltransferase HpnB
MLLTGLAVLALLAWLYLVLFHGRFWWADQRLETIDPLTSTALWPDVTAIIPARNEASMIGECITSHLRSRYPGRYQLILVDDGSTDGTAEIARQAAAALDEEIRLVIATAPLLPDGWSGKLWAIHHGLQIAADLTPNMRYLLLTDADIVHGSDTLTQLVAKAEAEGRALVSLLARLDDRGLWAGLLIPAFVFFFQKLYPFPRVNDPRHPCAAAAGGCMLVERAALEEAGGLLPIRHELIDDCALARLIKGRPPRHSIWLGLTREVVSLRDNRRLRGIWNMVARTAYAQLRYSPVLLLGTVTGMAFLYLLGPFLVFIWPLIHPLARLLGLAVWGLMTLAYVPTLRSYGRSWWQGIALPVAALLYTLMTLASAWRHWRGRGGRWKGRSYSLRGVPKS